MVLFVGFRLAPPVAALKNSSFVFSRDLLNSFRFNAPACAAALIMNFESDVIVWVDQQLEAANGVGRVMALEIKLGAQELPIVSSMLKWLTGPAVLLFFLALFLSLFLDPFLPHRLRFLAEPEVSQQCVVDVLRHEPVGVSVASILLLLHPHAMG